MRRSLAAIIFFTAATSGCSDPSVSTPPLSEPDASVPSCTLPYLGSKTKDPEIELTALGVDGKSKVLADGDEVALTFPPQGGRVIFIGVRATNVDPCAVQITGALQDLSTMQTRLDGRTVNLVATGDGYGASVDSQIASFANIPVCPNQWASTDVFGNLFDVSLTLQDHDGRMATKDLHVKPVCAEPEKLAECMCICKHGYVLGEDCSADAGTP